MLEHVYVASLQPLGYAASGSTKYTIFNGPVNSKIIGYLVVSNSEVSGQHISESGICICIL